MSIRIRSGPIGMVFAHLKRKSMIIFKGKLEILTDPISPTRNFMILVYGFAKQKKQWSIVALFQWTNFLARINMKRKFQHRAVSQFGISSLNQLAHWALSRKRCTKLDF